jgi:hypothetical protein
MALLLLSDPDLATSLMVAADDRDASVQRQAMLLIGRARVMLARDIVAVRLSDGNPDVRAAARDAYRKLSADKR